MKPNKGFTLIELLVVIAIIGILSAVVLAALNDARDRASDSSVKGSLSNARAQAEIFYDTDPSRGYTGVCGDDTIIRQYEGAKKAARSTASGEHGCDGDNNGYWIAVELVNPTAEGDFWCVDHKGFAGAVTGLPLGDAENGCN